MKPRFCISFLSAFVLIPAVLAQTTPPGCTAVLLGPVGPSSAGASSSRDYFEPGGGASKPLASIIPTPGLTCSSTCGTTGVRCAADASRAVSGQGEALNQSFPARPAAASSTPAQVFFLHGLSREPSVSSLALGQNVQGYMNALCGGQGISPSSAPGVPGGQLGNASRIRSAATLLPANSFAILGSQDLTLATLPSGSQVVAWVNNDNTTLFTAIRSADGSSIKNSAQFPVGPNSQNVIAADFNGDGVYDLAVSSFGSLSNNTGGNVRIFLGNSDGTFNTGTVINTVPTPVAMHTGDFNGDGKTDLVVADVNDDKIAVLLGNGDGTFQSPTTLSVSASPHSIVVDDFNSDGKLDLASANYLGGVSVYLGLGNGTFKPEVKYSSGKGEATFLASADMNGDGKTDLIVANPNANAVAFLYSNGDGTFQSPVLFASGAEAEDFGLAMGTDGAVLISPDNVAGNAVATTITSAGVPSASQLYPLASPPTGIAAIDMNGDKYPDMIAASGAISILLRNPSGSFKSPVNYTLQSGSQAVAVAAGDMNGDGKNDVVTSSTFTTPDGAYGGTVDIALGNGDGTLGHQNSYPMGGFPGGAFGSAPSGIVLGDFNGDKKLDVAAGFQTSPGGPNAGGVSVFLGNGDGTLRPAVSAGGGSNSVYALAAADFNGDGKLDLAAGTGSDRFDGGALMILLGNGDGTFQPAKTSQVGSPAGVPYAIAAADINGDGKPDIVAAVSSTNGEARVVVLLGNGDGTFRQQSPIQTQASGSAIAILDLNGDGRPDVVVGDCCGYSESVYLLGNGDGTFQAPQHFGSGSSVQSFAVTSWNNDGVPGLAVAQQVGTVMALEGVTLTGILSAGAQVTSAAGGVGALAPGSLASAFGADLANGQPNATTLPWPATFEGTSVLISDSSGARTPAPLTYVSQGQVNFQIPNSVAKGAASIAITSGDGVVSTAQTTLAAYAPALFALNASNLAAAVAICVSSSGAQTAEYPYQVANGALVAQPLNLAACSETVLELYATGVDTATASNTQVTMGGIAAPVLFAGPQGTFPGLDQINIVIPQSLAGKGNVPIILSAAGTASNTVNVTIQ